jgi:molecular chaperone HscB
MNDPMNDVITAVDHFAIFSLPRKLNLDVAALEKSFYSQSRKLHPDLFVRKSAEEQQWALEQSSRLNDAYRALKDPIARIQHLLELEGVVLEEQSSSATAAARASGIEKKQIVPPELLEEVFELNMQLQEIKMAKEMGETEEETVKSLEDSKKNFEARAEALMTEMHSLWNEWDALIDANADQEKKNIVRDKMVALLNQRSYIRNLLRDVNAVLA